MVDSADRERISTAKAEISSMLQEEELLNISLLVLANKQVFAAIHEYLLKRS